MIGPAGSAGASGAGAGEKVCPANLPGPALVRVQTPGGTPYCIDSTEVTIGQYTKFLEANLNDDMSGLPEACKSNSSFKPFNKTLEDVGDCPGYEYDPTKTDPERPIQCVHWCDAYAYCQYAGKRLCGKVGGGSLAHKEAATPEAAQWYNACSQGGKTKFSYGSESDKNACFIETPKDNNSVPGVAEKPTCHGNVPPYDAIYNLSGSLYEWQDACEKESGDGQNIVCSVLGGTYNTVQDELSGSCQREALLDRASTGWGIGFRCCLD
ncbi:MAG: SUMF1/EgtB/PvdO family nonheme iron enzyme [Polyangiaceae bacterium]|nr:SUMF1/EgtB/PvdO family nonheme iron enzyme [Polyangiaceae bacterium]